MTAAGTRSRAGRWRRVTVAVLIAAGAAVTVLNFWTFLYSMGDSMGAGLHDYGRIEHFVLTTAYGDPVPMKNPEDGSSHLGTHFHPVLFLVSALNRLVPWDHVYGLLMALGWFGAVVALGALAHRLTGRTDLAVLLATGFFFNMYMRRNFFSGHYEHLQALCVILAAYSAAGGGWVAFAGWILGAAIVREDVPIYLAGFLAYEAVAARTAAGRRIAWGVAAGCAVYFVAVMTLVLPKFTAGYTNASLLQATWGRGSTVPQVVVHLAGHPAEVLRAFFNGETFHVLQSFCLLPLLDPVRFMVTCAGPITVMGLSLNEDYRAFRYYSSAPFIGLCAVAAAWGCARLCRRRRPRLAVWLLCANLGISLNMCWTDRLVPGAPKPRWPYALTTTMPPFPVTPRALRIIRALRAYPTTGLTTAAGFYTFVHVPFSRDRWSLNVSNLTGRKPDLLFLDEQRDLQLTVTLSGAGSAAGLRRLIAAGGYDRRELTDGCFVYVRRPRPVRGPAGATNSAK